MVIDDEKEVRNMIRTALEEKGYSVDEASNGEDGARRYREKPADVLIVDIFMPKKEGLETILDIQKDYPNAKCIVISGGGLTSSFDYLHHAKAFGAKRIFVKPFPVGDLLQAVDDLLLPSAVPT
jgi:YesN/AraC family two-component response regulator